MSCDKNIFQKIIEESLSIVDNSGQKRKSLKMSGEIYIGGLKKVDVLIALYNHAEPIGMGIFTARKGSDKLEVQEAQNILNYSGYVDYAKGKPLKVDLSGDFFDPWLYDRDNGSGTAARCVEKLRNRAV